MGKRRDLTNMIFGELKVIEMLYDYNDTHRTYCKCIGKDNKEAIVRADALVGGATVSTKGAGKSGKPLDLTGKKFGLLTAIKATDKRASNSSITWECKCDCGNPNIVYVPSHQLVRGHTLSCGCKHESKWEMLIKDLLTSLNIEFIPQKRFKDCKNKKETDMLPFDFYIEDKNLAIEYDGLHHYEPIKGWGGEEKFNIIQENDAIKNQYCFEHNITLLRIPYTYSEKEVKDTIVNILSPATITM